RKTGSKQREFTEEAVERRHAGNRQRCHAETHAWQRQGVQYATQTRQQARAAAVTQRTCYKEKQAFSERVVDDVGDAALQRQPRAEDGERQAEEHPAKLSDGRPG